MKTIKKTVAVLLSLCLMMSMFTLLAVNAATETTQTYPHTYEVYDEYFKPFKAAKDASTQFVNNSAWSLQTKKAGGEWVPEDMKYVLNDQGYDHIAPAFVANSNMYQPGFTYCTVTNGPTRYVGGMAIPANRSDMGTEPFKYDVAYAFTAPQAGVYKVHKANLDKIFAFDMANYIYAFSWDKVNLDYGMRITVDDNIVWPAYDDARAYDDPASGRWAKFNSDEPKNAFATPNVENLEVQKGSVIRIEFTQFTTDNRAWYSRINAIMDVTYVEPLKEEVPVPTEKTVFDIYDYYTSLVTNTANTSNWSVETNVFNRNDPTRQGWAKATVLSELIDGYRYLHPADSWGNWPGVKFFWNQAAIDAGERNHFGMITPFCMQGGNWLGWDTAYSFEAPYSGNFTFSKGNQDKVVSWDDMNYFQFRDKSIQGMTAGFRITVNGRTVFPVKSHPDYFEGYARFGNAEGVSPRVEIPTMNMYLEKKDIVRVELKEFANGAAVNAWDQEIMGLVSMTYNADNNVIATPYIREYTEFELYSDMLGGKVDSAYDMDPEEVLYSTVATRENDGVNLTINAPAQGVKFVFNGYEFVMNGENSSIKAPGKVAEPFAVAASTDNMYDVTLKISPMVKAGKVTATVADLTVNGISTTKMYPGMIPQGVKDKGFTVTNISGDIVSIAPGTLVVADGSKLVIDRVNNVLYVDDYPSIEEVKANIVNPGLYTFSDTLATGVQFIRNNGEKFTIAVKGDLNGDATVNIIDLVSAKKVSVGGTATFAQKTAMKFGDSAKSDADSLIDLRKYLLVYVDPNAVK